MYWLYAITGLALIFSLIASRTKTLKALKISFSRFMSILPAFLLMLVLVSIVLFLIPGQIISDYLGAENKVVGVLFACFFGSITLMPGFIAYPLANILLNQGVAYMVLAAFTTTLMMIGILTYPIEKQYFGVKVTIIRNTISLFIALIITLVIGIFFGEIIL